MDKTMIKVNNKDFFVLKQEYIEYTYKNLNTKGYSYKYYKESS